MATSEHIITLSDGTTFTVYPLEQNGPNNQSTPRQIQGVLYDGDSALASGANGAFVLNDNMTYRFVTGFSFNVEKGFAAYQIVDMDPAISSGDSTGLNNDTTTYTADVVINGGVTQTVSIQGQNAQTFTELISLLNANITFATAEINGNGDIQVTSNSKGSDSSVSITDNNLFSSLTNYNTINTATNPTNTFTFTTHSSTFDSVNNLTTIYTDEAVQSGNFPQSSALKIPSSFVIYYTVPSGEQISSILLNGRGVTNYGQSISQDMVRMVENFASSSSPPNPLVGQLWYDTSNETLKRYTASGWTADVDLDNSNLIMRDPQNNDADMYLSGDDDVSADTGATLRTGTNPTSGDSVFRVISSGGTELLRVEYDGHIETTNGITSSSTTVDSTIAGTLGVGKTSVTSGYTLDLTGPMNIDSGNIRFDDGAGIESTTGESITTDGTGSIWQVSADFDVASNTLYVDSTNGRVGVNKSPTVPFDVQGNSLFTGTITSTNDFILKPSTTEKIHMHQDGRIVVDSTEGSIIVNGTSDQITIDSTSSPDGQININGTTGQIEGLVDPDSAQEAATKAYVDSVANSQDELQELDDVINVTNAENSNNVGEYVLVNAGTTGDWTELNHTVNNIFDVSASAPADNDLLQYDAGTGNWTSTSVATATAPKYDIQTTDGTASFTYNFTVPSPPTGRLTLQVFVNGIKQQEGTGRDYTVDYTTSTITFNTGSVPTTDQELEFVGFG